MWKLVCGLVLLAAMPPTLLAIKVKCNHPESINEGHIHFCCKHPDGHNQITEDCAKETGFKMPAPNEEAVEDVTVEQLVHSTCWGKCVFEKYKFLKGEKLDMDVVRNHYKVVHAEDPEYEREMISAFDHCHGKSEQATVHFFNTLGMMTHSKLCDPQPSVILSCVIYKFFHNCPTDRWSNTQECKDTLAFARKCKDALTTM